MHRSNFFYKFFNHINNSDYQITKYKSLDKLSIKDELKQQILDVDKKITDHSQALFEAQIVKLKSTFSQSNNFIEKIGKNMYKEKLEDSISWYQKQLKILYIERRNLQINLEKINGIFWINRIKRFLSFLIIGLLLLILIFIFISGFMIVIYLLPIIILFYIGYIIVKKKY